MTESDEVVDCVLSAKAWNDLRRLDSELMIFCKQCVVRYRKSAVVLFECFHFIAHSQRNCVRGQILRKYL